MYSLLTIIKMSQTVLNSGFTTYFTFINAPNIKYSFSNNEKFCIFFT